jgi:hypothetical protein
MSIGLKAGRVAQVFAVQLLNKFPREQIHFHFYTDSVFSCQAFDIRLVTFCYVCISDGAE